MKVRGFQVAPAELEGHILGHSDVADVCVVGMPDEYSGELPMAWVVLRGRATMRIEKNPLEGYKIKASIIKVRAL
jgi:acyl-CoA synthetase (AMP-forming)/AMP-acid ligase II